MGDLSATRGAIAGGELEQDEGQVKILPMMDGGAWNAQLCPALSDPEFPGRGDERLARIIEQHVSGECSKADAAKAKGR